MCALSATTVMKMQRLMADLLKCASAADSSSTVNVLDKYFQKPRFAPSVGHHFLYISVPEGATARLRTLLERTPGRHTPYAQHALGGMYERGKMGASGLQGSIKVV